MGDAEESSTAGNRSFSKQDSLRIYHLDEHARERTEHHGFKEPLDLGAPLIL